MLKKVISRGYSIKTGGIVPPNIASKMMNKQTSPKGSQAQDQEQKLTNQMFFKPLVICGPPCSGKVSPPSTTLTNFYCRAHSSTT